MKNGTYDLKHIDITFEIFNLISQGRYFTNKMIVQKYGCSRATVMRSIQYLREHQHMQICYDKTLGVYRAGEYVPATYREKWQRRMMKNGDEILLKKKLYSIYGKDWKKHYEVKND